MDGLPVSILFALWCWGINMSLNVYGYAMKRLSACGIRDYPLDLRARLSDTRRLLGDSTTFGGLLLVCAGGWMFSRADAHLPYVTLALLVYVGHAVGSFVKRRLAYAEGEYAPGIDHGDYVVIAGTYAVLRGIISPAFFVLLWVTTVLFTPAVTFCAWKLGIRQQRL